MRCLALLLLISTAFVPETVRAQEKSGPFEWIDAATGESIGPLKDKAELPAEMAGKRLNVVAKFDGAKSVRFDLSGPKSLGRAESEAPFSLFGDSGGTFKGERLPGGSYRLEAIAFSEPNGKGNEIGRAAVTFLVSGEKQKDAFELIDLSDAFPVPQFSKESPVNLGNEFQQWEPMTMMFTGPESGENIGKANPFVDLAYAVRFRHSEDRDEEGTTVYGFFAADGNAAETSAESGKLWRVHFVPDRPGKWVYESVMTSRTLEPGAKRYQVSHFGEFEVRPAVEGVRGILWHEPGSRYLSWSGSGEIFLKGGADSPENFLGYADFDGTRDTGAHGKDGKDGFLHRFEPHVRDWKEGDPTWQDGKGKGMIGALNYLAGKGINSVYMLPFNVAGGDGKDTWPWTGPEVRDRFDVSKLDQWNLVFDHMDRLGLRIHIILQEQENDQELDGGNLGPERKLYLRELIARFAHHPGIIWNLGEENTNTTSQQKEMADYIRELDPYDHAIVVHTFPPKKEQIYRPLLGHKSIDGPSLQVGRKETHDETVKWLRQSKNAGHPWFVCHDEVGPANRGVDPDSRTGDNNQKDIVREALWGNLLAGGSGAEWYFGYQNPHSDLNCEDWRSRDRLWDYTRYALEFFRDLPVAEMESRDNLTDRDDAWCFAKPGEIYVVYIPAGTAPKLDLSREKENLTLRFFDPFEGKWESVTKTMGAEAGTVKELKRVDQSRDMIAVLRAKW